MTSSDIINRIYFLTKTNASSFGVDNLILSVNKGYNRVASLIMQADGRWQWDDDNQSDLPISTQAIVSGQQDYSFSVTHLKLLRAEIKYNGATTFTKLDPKDEQDDPEALNNVATGAPQCYDLLGRSIFLYPIPNYSQSASLKLYFQRGPAEFTGAEIWSAYTSSDSAATKAAYTLNGTKAPGFDSKYHDLIPLWAAYDYAVANGLPQSNGWLQEIMRLEAQIQVDYGRRDKDDSPQLTMKSINFR